MSTAKIPATGHSTAPGRLPRLRGHLHRVATGSATVVTSPVRRTRAVAAAHPRIFGLGAATAGTAAITAAAPALLPGFPTGLALATGAITGAIMSFGLLMQRRLARRLGSLTAVAALAVLASVVLTLLALALPHCPGGGVPGGPVPGRCRTADVGTWMTIGAVVPLTVALLLGGPIVAVRIFGRVTRVFYRFVTANRGTSQRRRIRRTSVTVPDTARGRDTSGDKQQARRRARAARRTTRRNR